jgi:hypothetical protein
LRLSLYVPGLDFFDFLVHFPDTPSVWPLLTGGLFG